MSKKKKAKNGMYAGLGRKTNQHQQPQAPYNPIVTVQGYKQFHEQAEKLRGMGLVEMPDSFGGFGGRGRGSSIDFADYINSKLSCEVSAGASGKGPLPLLHVTSGFAQPVVAVNGHKGSFITWGDDNKLPNIVSFLCSLSPYTAAALKFNLDLITGMGPKPMYQYSQYVGGNLLDKQISYEYAGTLLKGWKIDILRQINDLKKDRPAADATGTVVEGGTQTSRGTSSAPTKGEIGTGVEGGTQTSRGNRSAPTKGEIGTGVEGGTQTSRGNRSAPTKGEAGTGASNGGETGTGASNGGETGTVTTNDRVLGGSSTEEVGEYEQALRDRLAEIDADLAVWEQTMAELKDFQEHNNLLETFQQLYADMLQFNICYPEIELQQTYIDPETKHEVKSFKWDPKAVGIKYRNAKTVRLEQMNQNKIEHVYISNQWLSSPEQTVITQGCDLKIDAMLALNPQCPSADLERIARETRKANVSKGKRPTHVILPVRYNEYGHPYYPIPAWYSVFSGDVYTYASILVCDRNKRRQNSNVIGRIIYIHSEYLDRLYYQKKADTPDAKKEIFNKLRDQINNFLEDRDNTGKPLVAYTFLGSDGKVYKSWEIVEIEENSKSVAEANKEELAEISSIILFAWGVDSPLIGNTPGTVTRSGGTDLRERYLLKQVNMSLMQRLVLNVMDIYDTRNKWDPHLTWVIQREVLTTLDNSKTGVTTAETSY